MTPWFQRQMRNTDPEVFINSILALSDWNGPISLLPQITAPTLMLAGALEDPDGENARDAARMPNARSVTLPDLDHITAYEHSDLILAHALPFLANLKLR
jgi:pimeloyl-ACP methyl ester carboxylesterase